MQPLGALHPLARLATEALPSADAPLAVDPRHMGVAASSEAPGGFYDQLMSTLNAGVASVNRDQLSSEDLNLKMAVAPDSVNLHDVMIASEQAQFSLELTKSVLRKTVDAYNQLTSLR